MFYSLIFISGENKKSDSAAGFPDKSLWKKMVFKYRVSYGCLLEARSYSASCP